MTEGSPQARANDARRSLYQHHILDAAERCFARRGYEGTRMEDIAREAKVALATLYRHYEGKRPLFAALQHARVEELFDRARAAVHDDRDPVEALIAFASGYFRFLLDHPDTVRMQLRSKASWGLDDEQIAWRAPRDHHAALVRRCIDAGRVINIDPVLAAQMMAAMHQVQLADWIHRGMVEDHDSQVATMVGFLERAFVVSAS